MSAPIETVNARIQSITEIAEKAAHSRSYSWEDDDERGYASGERSLADEVLKALQTETENPREIIKEVNRRLRWISSVWTRDQSAPYTSSTEWEEGHEKGEIAFAKEVRRILNAPLVPKVGAGQ